MCHNKLIIFKNSKMFCVKNRSIYTTKEFIKTNVHGSVLGSGR